MSLQTKDTPAGRRYDVVWDRGRRRKRFTRKKDAETFESNLKADRSRGQYVDPSDRTTVSEYARTYVTARRQRGSTRTRQMGDIRNHIDNTPLGGRRLQDVRYTELQSWATGRADVLSLSTARGIVSLVRRIFTAAQQDGLVGRNPAERVRLPDLKRKRVVPLTVDQVRLLAESTPDRCKAMVVTQAGLGVRKGELFALRVMDVDFLHRVVHVREQINQDGRRAPLKNVADDDRMGRDVPLPQTVADAISAHLVKYPAPSWESEIFRSTVGKPFDHQSYDKTFKRSVKRAGLPLTEKGREQTTHALRHHYVSLLLANRVSVANVAEWTGDTVKTILETYSHLMPNTEDVGRNAIDNAWAVAVTG